jgi:hypothetical protein
MNDIGPYNDTQCSQEILDGTYEYPPSIDKWTKKVLQEALYSYKVLNGESINTSISVNDFQEFWQHSKELTSSSYRELYCGHYKVAGFNRDLPALNAARLTACVMKASHSSGGGLDSPFCLRNEKTRGNHHIHKMQAICLLEADFNFFNKMVHSTCSLDDAICP